MHSIVVLWAHPRSLSTAVERVFMERGDFTVLHEPFSYLYYAEEEHAPITHFHYDSEQPRAYDEIKQSIFAEAEKSPVFIKDMCDHCFDHLMGDDDFLRQLTNTFLIRNPAKAIPSHYAMNPDLTYEEVGYEQQYRVMLKVAELFGNTPIVVDAADIQRNPERTIATYCEALGIEPMPESLTWQAGHRKEWDSWKEWHTDAAQSTGINANTREYEANIDNTPLLKALYDYHLPFYRAMHKLRLKP